MRPAGFWRRSAAWSLDAIPAGLAALALCQERMQVAAAALATGLAQLVELLAQRMAGALAGWIRPGAATLLAMANAAVRDPGVLAAAAPVRRPCWPRAAAAAGVRAAVPGLCVGFERTALLPRRESARLACWWSPSRAEMPAPPDCCCVSLAGTLSG